MSSSKPLPQPPPTATQANSAAALLNSLQHALSSQLSHLPGLHSTLGLSHTALQADLDDMRAALLGTVEACVKRRRDEVDDWHRRCGEVERASITLAKCLGAFAVATKGAGSVGEIGKVQVLPTRFEMLEAYRDQLLRLYSAKFDTLRTLHARLNNLIHTLGPDFYSTDLTRQLDITSAQSIDVTPERLQRYEKEIIRGKHEIQRRLAHLAQTLEHVTWLHTELGIPLPNVDDTRLAFTLSNPSTPSTTSYESGSTNPFASHTEPAADHCARVFAQYVARLEEAADEGLESAGVEGVEPTLGLMAWAERVKSELEDLKARRETTIQAMYDALESLWRRLNVPDEAADEFIEAHRGSTEETVRAYEEELARMMQVRRERMGAFIESAREEIRGLWDDLMFGPDEREGFAAMYDDDDTSEEVLTTHEAEIARLKDERSVKASVLALLRKWDIVCEEGRQLAVSAADQSRLLGRGPRGDPGRLLREEKMRKRVAKEKPKLENELRNLIPRWEHEHGRMFMMHGHRALDVVEAGADAGKENGAKKRAPKPNVVKTPNIPARSTTPAPPTVNINGKRTTPLSRSASTQSASQAPPNKRARMTPSAQSRTMQTPIMSASTSHIPSHTGRTVLGSHNIPPPLPQTQATSKAKQPAPTSRIGLGIGLGHPTAPSLKYGGQPVHPQPTQRTISTTSSGSTAGLYARLSDRARRESFRPRASVDGWAEQVGILNKHGAGWGGWIAGDGVMEEDEEE